MVIKDAWYADGYYIFKTFSGDEIKVKAVVPVTPPPPHAGTTNLIFETLDGVLHRGRYVFKDYKISQPCFIDQIGNDYKLCEVKWWKEAYAKTKF